ncbi:MAG: XRE family transcriptional regulator [Clostridia bacterium]|nr:XRE family transcriptional regulator [Clostridia bacterium]MDD4048040.1 XRE family transcriptional regulator [Clostridia bacterium]
MVGKNIKYYRLLNKMTLSALAKQLNVTSMAISNYENGLRNPDINTLKKIASIFNVEIAKLVAPQNDNLIYNHGAFRKNSTLPVSIQDLIGESVEKYYNRFFTVVDILGSSVLPDVPLCNQVKLSGDAEANADAMREWLKLSKNGPVCNLISILENTGILIYKLDIDNDKFSGKNGFVNKRPYIVINSNMNPERQRSTIAHELAHLCFNWSADMDIKQIEKMATAISGAFLFSKEDAIRELGVHRSAIEKDMILVAIEYGISMLLLAMRAKIVRIIKENVYRNFMIRASQHNWRKNEPSRIAEEKTSIFEQLTYRAVVEGSISIQKGAELLEKSYKEVESSCFLDGVQ